MNRIGQVALIGLILVVFFLFMGVLIGGIILQQISDFSYATMPASAQAALNKGSNMLGFLDTMSIIIMIIYAVIIISLSSAGVGGNSPALFISIIIYIPVLLASGGISNWVQETSASPLFSSYIPNIPITYNVMVNLPLICLVIGAVSLMFAFITSRGSSYAY